MKLTTLDDGLFADLGVVSKIGMIEPVLDSLSSVEGVFGQRAEVIGSFAKGTVSNDEDACIDVLLPIAGEQALDMVKVCLENCPWNVAAYKFTFMVEIGWGTIGIVPGIVSKYKNYYHITDIESRNSVLTNPIMHVNYVRNSNQQEVIKAVKLAIRKNGIVIPSLAVDMLVIDALKECISLGFDGLYTKVFKYIRDDFSSMDLLDPSNSKNNITKDLSQYDRKIIADFAAKHLEGL